MKLLQVFSLAVLVICLTGPYTVYASHGPEKTDIEDLKYVHYPGDILLGGLFSLHAEYNVTSGICSRPQEADGVMPLEATLYFLDEINRSGLLKFTLGIIAFDTCDSHSFALEQALHFIHSHGHTKNSHGTCRHTDDANRHTDKEEGPSAFDFDKVVGIIVGLPSSVTVSLAQLLRLFHMPQISFMSTSPLLSDKRRYDYFFRTVPSDVNQVRAIVEILKFYKWNHISIVYSDDEYGNRGLHELEQLASNASLCIATKLKMPSYTEYEMQLMAYTIFEQPYGEILGKLLQAETNIVVIFADHKSARMLFGAVHQAGITNEFVWIGSDAWGGREDVINDYPKITEGAITVQLNTRELRHFSDHYADLLPSQLVCQRNPFFCKLWNECDGQRPQNEYLGNDEKVVRVRNHGTTVAECNVLGRREGSHPAIHIDRLRDAIYAYVYALRNMHQELCGDTKGVCEEMHNAKGSKMKHFLARVNFTEPDGTMFKFYDESDGTPRYTIMNVQKAPHNGKAYQWTEIGKYSQDEERRPTLLLNDSAATFKTEKPRFPAQTRCKPCDPSENEVRTDGGAENQCCWKCRRCEIWQFPANNTCGDCPHGYLVNITYIKSHPKTTSFTNVSCSQIEAHFLDYSSLIAAPVLAISSLGIIITIICGFIIFSNHATPIVKAAGREHLTILIIGVLFSYAMNFVILHGPTKISCSTVRLLGVCYTICHSALLIKIARIYRIFNTKEPQKTQKLKYISPKSQVAMTVAFIFVELVIIAVWWCFMEPTVLEIYPTRWQRELVCSDLYDLQLLPGLCYPLMLLFPMAYFAFRTRGCPAAFAEAKFTGYGIYLTFINVLTFVLIYIGNNAIQIRVITVCIGLCLNASVIVVTSFLTKVYVIVLRPHKNSKERIMSNGRYSTARTTNSGQVMPNGNHCTACDPAAQGMFRHQSNPELTSPLVHTTILKALESGFDSNKPRSRCNTMEREPHSVV